MTVDPPHRTEPPASSRLARVRNRGGVGPGPLARASLAAILLAAMLLPVSSEVRPAVAGVAPGCTTADVLTRYRYQADWYRSLLDTKYRLSSTSKPSDLVSVGRSGASGYGSIRKVALADLTAMYRAAKAAGAPFAVQSAYRSYATQVATFNMWVRKVGYTKAKLASARPGHSEHQLGTALDLKTPGGAEPWYYVDWGNTKAGAWLRRNAWKYGWVMSYPKAKSPSATCYKYEPWHFRYVGRAIASKIHSSALAPREWLYLNGSTKTWTGGLPNATPTPKPTPTPTPSPSPSVEPSASPSELPSTPPSSVPTDEPTVEPTVMPSDVPSTAPSADPTQDPAEPPGDASPAPASIDPAQVP
jgi:LAS superfamily LD-carboxypeptidase LdcB